MLKSLLIVCVNMSINFQLSSVSSFYMVLILFLLFLLYSTVAKRMMVECLDEQKFAVVRVDFCARIWDMSSLLLADCLHSMVYTVLLMQLQGCEGIYGRLWTGKNEEGLTRECRGGVGCGNSPPMLVYWYTWRSCKIIIHIKYYDIRI